MVDGTGMCGGCRVIVNGQTRFACVEGPEFDAHLVDFDSLQKRNAMYREFEKLALERFLQNPQAELEATSHHCKLQELLNQQK
jgi:ferredoxin--NADP+ reductase